MEMTTRFEDVQLRAEDLAEGNGDPPSAVHYAEALCEELDRILPHLRVQKEMP